MTTATSRDMLEALLWRTLPGISADHVDAILKAADLYAASAAADEAAPARRLYAALVEAGKAAGHGSPDGYRHHKSIGEDPCEECAEHMREKWRNRYYTKRDRKRAAA